MCLSSNRSLWLGSQSSWNWEGWSAYHTIARRLRVGELWSLEGKAGSVPKKECWAGPGHRSRNGGRDGVLVPTRALGVTLERKDP